MGQGQGWIDYIDPQRIPKIFQRHFRAKHGIRYHFFCDPYRSSNSKHFGSGKPWKTQGTTRRSSLRADKRWLFSPQLGGYPEIAIGAADAETGIATSLSVPVVIGIWWYMDLYIIWYLIPNMSYVLDYIYIVKLHVVSLDWTNYSKQLPSAATTIGYILHDAAADGHPTGAVLQFEGWQWALAGNPVALWALCVDVWDSHTHRLNVYLLGGLEHEFYDFPYVGNNNPNWLIFFTGVARPPTRY